MYQKKNISSLPLFVRIYKLIREDNNKALFGLFYFFLLTKWVCYSGAMFDLHLFSMGNFVILSMCAVTMQKWLSCTHKVAHEWIMIIYHLVEINERIWKSSSEAHIDLFLSMHMRRTLFKNWAFFQHFFRLKIFTFR
jgi:hypothetical protein